MNRLPLYADSATQSLVSKSLVSKSKPSVDPFHANPVHNDHGPFSLGKHLETVEPRSTRFGDSDIFVSPHTLFAPIHYEDGYAYPLVVWLHGPGDNENQLRTVLPLVSMRNHVAVAPRGTSADGDVRGAFRWKQTSEDITEATQRTIDCIEIATDRFHVHPERTFVAGYECGGTMALRIALENPEYFAGAISIGGPLPQGLNLLRKVNSARHLPLMIANSLGSKKYPSERVCSDLRLLHTAGFSLDLRRYPCGDELTTKMLSDLDCWIMQRVCTASATAHS